MLTAGTFQIYPRVSEPAFRVGLGCGPPRWVLLARLLMSFYTSGPPMMTAVGGVVLWLRSRGGETKGGPGEQELADGEKSRDWAGGGCVFSI